MFNKINFLILSLALIAITACQSEPDQGQGKKEHVWKEQTGAIDKAREVESILKAKKDQENQ